MKKYLEILGDIGTTILTVLLILIMGGLGAWLVHVSLWAAAAYVLACALLFRWVGRWADSRDDKDETKPF